MREKTLIRIIILLTSIIVVSTSVLTLTTDMNFKGIPALSLGILSGLMAYEEWNKKDKNLLKFYLFTIACVLNCFDGIILFL